ncbi:AT-rich interactive domain-containing protein 3C isoform X3 [Amblyraja radiata]|uniref:AT-rich interactive domain-containing protein 3C isoform X3 n=1 Tax=Amblyraja radiata TaxID=386614 RepID=UPI001401F30A|nr:AT-rich interactive domain-containing protein 3C isoform X3 [Amblyraja radiata]
MVDNASVVTKAAMQGLAVSSNGLSLISSGSAHCQTPHGMKLEAVMENLQRQQQARLDMEERQRKERERDARRAGGDTPSQQQQQQQQQQAMTAAVHQQLAAAQQAAALAAVRAAAMAGLGDAGLGSSGATRPLMSAERRRRRVLSGLSGSEEEELEGEPDPGEDAGELPEEENEEEEEEEEEEDEEEEEEEEEEVVEEVMDAGQIHRAAGVPNPGHSLKGTAAQFSRFGQCHYHLPGQSHSPVGIPQQAQSQQQEWTYEEQFKQLYELDDDPKRKEFLDDLFSFMQKRGTPVNRIPIMAKQVLDLYSLYKLVTEKGGLVEVINKKIWREITKGLNLPTSITSAAFTLRTQYMKYLYPYECEKRGLSSPGELQAAIDSNRREGRRQSYGSTLFNYSPVGTPNILSSPKIQMPTIAISTHNGGHISHGHSIKKEESALSTAGHNRIAIPLSIAGHHVSASQAFAAQAAVSQMAAAQAVALDQLREKLDSGEPPEKRKLAMAEEQQRFMQQALQQNLLAMASQIPMNIKINSRADDRQETALNLSTNGISSINMSIEINGVVYTGVLFARRPVIPVMSGSNGNSSCSQGIPSPAIVPQAQPSSSSSHSHTPTSSAP